MVGSHTTPIRECGTLSILLENKFIILNQNANLKREKLITEKPTTLELINHMYGIVCNGLIDCYLKHARDESETKKMLQVYNKSNPLRRIIFHIFPFTSGGTIQKKRNFC